MKKSLLLILFVLPFFVKAQYAAAIATSGTPQYTYVGTLNDLPSDLGNYQKIKVEIFGGSWGSDGLGSTTYTIANRYGLQVNEVITGSSNNTFFTLQAYTNSSNNNIDFYVVTTTWSAYAVKSVMLQSPTYPVTQSMPITSSTTAPTGTPLALNIVPVMITDASGNIGIGTINPNGFKLAVKGNIHAQQVNVDLNNWADYVFKPSYHLPTLDEVKTYIDQNHHLPEIPSEQEIAKYGLNLGDMNKVLVKKVEELMLYVIEKDKQLKEEHLTNQSQQEQIDQLKQQSQLKTQQEEINQLKQQVQLLIKASNKN